MIGFNAKLKNAVLEARRHHFGKKITFMSRKGPLGAKRNFCSQKCSIGTKEGKAGPKVPSCPIRAQLAFGGQKTLWAFGVMAQRPLPLRPPLNVVQFLLILTTRAFQFAGRPSKNKAL